MFSFFSFSDAINVFSSFLFHDKCSPIDNEWICRLARADNYRVKHQQQLSVLDQPRKTEKKSKQTICLKLVKKVNSPLLHQETCTIPDFASDFSVLLRLIIMFTFNFN